jgi:hypothetical protein
MGDKNGRLDEGEEPRDKDNRNTHELVSQLNRPQVDVCNEGDPPEYLVDRLLQDAACNDIAGVTAPTRARTEESLATDERGAGNVFPDDKDVGGSILLWGEYASLRKARRRLLDGSKRATSTFGTDIDRLACLGRIDFRLPECEHVVEVTPDDMLNLLLSVGRTALRQGEPVEVFLACTRCGKEGVLAGKGRLDDLESSPTSC